MQDIDINLIDYAPINPNKLGQKKMRILKEEIKTHGLVRPIVVNRNGNRYTMIDGEHRTKICKELGYDTVSAYVLELDDTLANALLISLNNIHGEIDQTLQENLVAELLEEIPYEELRQRLRIPKSLQEEASEAVKNNEVKVEKPIDDLPEAPKNVPQNTTFTIKVSRSAYEQYNECKDFMDKLLRLTNG